MTGPRIGELFSGYGGLGIGVQSVYGGTIAWHSDIDKGACKILAHRYPDVPNIRDITTVKWTPDCPTCGESLALYDKKDAAGRGYYCSAHGWFDLDIRYSDPDANRIPEPVDILTGGSPCQDLSHAGRRAGMTDGTRSNLWVAMREAIARLRPAVVVWENVRGAYSAAADSAVESCAGCVGDGSGVHLRALGRVLGDLSDLGYDCRWHGLRAADVGAPHGRFRVFVVATDADGSGAGWVRRAVPSSMDQVRRSRVDIPATLDGGLLPTPTSSDANGPGPHGDGGADLRTTVGLLPTPRATDGTKGGPNQRGSSGDLMLPSAVAMLPTPQARDWKGVGPADANRHDPNLSAIGVILLQTPSVADSAGGHERRGGARGEELLLNGQAKEMQGGQWGDYAAAIARWESALGRPAPAPTMTSTKGNPQLSPVFVEWLMGLPAGWVTDVPGITRNEALKALGNGVVSQQCAEALRVMASWEVAA